MKLKLTSFLGILLFTGSQYSAQLHYLWNAPGLFSMKGRNLSD